MVLSSWAKPGSIVVDSVILLICNRLSCYVFFLRAPVLSYEVYIVMFEQPGQEMVGENILKVTR